MKYLFVLGVLNLKFQEWKQCFELFVHTKSTRSEPGEINGIECNVEISPTYSGSLTSILRSWTWWSEKGLMIDWVYVNLAFVK